MPEEQREEKLQIPNEMVVELSLAERTNRELLRQQAWNYFQMHAAQRLTTFNFYVVSATAIAAGIGLSYQAGFEFQELSLILSGLLVAVSFFFWKLEGRNVELITHAEDALRQFEKDVEEKTKAFPKDGDTPHVALLFLHENHKTNARQEDGKKYKVRFWKWHYKYDHCLRGIIGVFGLAGL